MSVPAPERGGRRRIPFRRVVLPLRAARQSDFPASGAPHAPEIAGMPYAPSILNIVITTLLFPLLAAIGAARGQMPVIPGEQRSFPAPDIDRQWQKEQNEALERARRRRAPPGERPVAPVLNDAAVAANSAVAELILETALQYQDWDTIERVLPLYAGHPRHDRQLYRFVKGAMLRARWRLGPAIDLYRQMLDADPTLNNVRFDLAVMQFENKSYRQAKRQFLLLADNPREPLFRELSLNYLKRIAQRARPSLNLTADLLHTDNYNQGSDVEYIYLWGLPFRNNNRRQSSSGQSLSVTLEQDVNLAGNHFLGYSAYFNALNYARDNHYDERTALLGLDYQYQSLRDTFSVGPVYTYRRLGGESYARDVGLSASYGRWLTPRWQAALGYRLLDRRYYRQPIGELYDGNIAIHSLNLMRAVSNRFLLYGGVFHEREKLGAADVSSRQNGVNGGFTYIAQGGLDVRMQLRYGRKRFDEENAFFGVRRRDAVTRLSLRLQYRPWTFQGITPRLVYQREKTTSNIPAFYGKSSNQLMLSFSKEF
ncbi:surface lipoprotein assembly modifier [Brenneria tiliae]|uniref:Surface lipoprotein assembly modifier n=1 Tax=Brenneria tiliae TaxID=2914984 RepID=A0ABT0MWZ4_9GAMM|nr:surface lipoprotein assembly modifier [Brenneria tiliae]MCL2894376.1 surface lipoprotein assembly modifier [Brenneria tiliae]